MQAWDSHVLLLWLLCLLPVGLGGQSGQGRAPAAPAAAFPFISMEAACGLARPAEPIIGCQFSVPASSVAVQCVIRDQFT